MAGRMSWRWQPRTAKKSVEVGEVLKSGAARCTNVEHREQYNLKIYQPKFQVNGATPRNDERQAIEATQKADQLALSSWCYCIVNYA